MWEVLTIARAKCVACFDGVVAGKLGLAGYIIYDVCGLYVTGIALWFGKEWVTNNETDIQALLYLL